MPAKIYSYVVDKCFRADDVVDDDGKVTESPIRKKGEIVKLKGDELMFALENKCVTKIKE